MVSLYRGAELEVLTPKPSIALATLVELLAASIFPKSGTAQSDSSDPKFRSAFLFDIEKKRLRLCTSAVLRRLFAQSDFKNKFDSSSGSGFIQNLDTPPYGIRSRIGGHLAEEEATRLPAAVDKLLDAVTLSLDAAMPSGHELSSLLLDKPEIQLNQLAKKIGAKFKYQANMANLVPLAFKAEGTVKDNDKGVAKVISAVERIEADNYFERMCSAVGDHLQHQRDCDEEDVEAALDSLKAEQVRVDSQITRFLNFLDDEALSRVRTTIALQIMETIANNAATVNRPGHKLLVEYVHRATCFIKVVKEVGYSVDLTANYGVAAEFELLDYFNRATFYSCLPVWAEWKTQIFEEKVTNKASTSYGVLREVSYRFRVNGQNPEFRKPAIEARLDEIEAELLSTETPLREQPERLCRRCAELIFLSIVIPKPNSEPLTEVTLSHNIQELLTQLKLGGKEAIGKVLQDLRSSTGAVQQIATALMSVVRTKSRSVLSQVQRRSSQQFICVKRGIIEWSRLEGASPGVRDLLVSPPLRSREQVEWFKHIEICDKPETPDLLFSVQVTTEVSEHSLVTVDLPYQVQAQRLLPQHLLQILWVPYCSKKDADSWTYKVSENVAQAASWVLPTSIHVEYDIETLQRKSNSKQADNHKQYHAAAITAFTILVYCCLWRVVQRLKESMQPNPVDFTTLMLRLQETGRVAESGDGDSYLYAAAQAIEAILAQNTSTRMQGIVLSNLTKNSSQYVKTGTFDALLSAFGLAISTPMPPVVPKIGLISYATRPCDELSSSSTEKGYLLRTQSYTATAVEQPFLGYKLQPERMQSDVINSLEQLKKQRLVQEEIGNLNSLGCSHIILLSHSYGSRQVNRAADHNSSLTPREFLEEVSKAFPDLTVYTILRDVFPATRLTSRDRDEAAFEILQAGDHTNFLQAVEKVRVRDIIPVYTFATLSVVGEEKRPQSGFCIYFLVSDQRVSDLDWLERPRRHLVNADRQSDIHPCLISVLRGLHFIEAERGVKNGQLIPVLDPFKWISPTTTEAAGEVEIMHSRRKGKVLLSYPALLNHVAHALNRRR